MPCCTFFGHHDIIEAINEQLYTILIELVEKHYVTQFYVGHQGGFDKLVKQQLQKLQKAYPSIQYTVVLAYFPTKYIYEEYASAETLYPDGLENTPPRYAINKRNQWMLDHADFVVKYTPFPFGNSAKWEEKARKKGITIFSLTT